MGSIESVENNHASKPNTPSCVGALCPQKVTKVLTWTIGDGGGGVSVAANFKLGPDKLVEIV